MVGVIILVASILGLGVCIAVISIWGDWDMGYPTWAVLLGIVLAGLLLI